MRSEYSSYTPYFETCAHIDMYICMTIYLNPDTLRVYLILNKVKPIFRVMEFSISVFHILNIIIMIHIL